MKYIMAILAGLAVVALITSCATPVVTPGTPASTNSVTGVVTPAVPPSTNYVPNATVGQITTTGTAVAGVLPQPWGGVLAGALALLSVGATAVAKIQSNKLNTTQGQLATAQAIHDTIIQGIESAGTASAAIKQSVAKTALANGNADAVEAAVNKITGSA